MDSRDLKIADAFNKAIAFYKENGFIDLTRFASYFKGIKYDSDDAYIHHMVNMYQMFLDTVVYKKFSK